jgi:hypothetical protein
MKSVIASTTAVLCLGWSMQLLAADPPAQQPGTTDTTTTTDSAPTATAAGSSNSKEAMQACLADQKANHSTQSDADMKKACQSKAGIQKAQIKNSTVPQKQ